MKCSSVDPDDSVLVDSERLGVCSSDCILTDLCKWKSSDWEVRRDQTEREGTEKTWLTGPVRTHGPTCVPAHGCDGMMSHTHGALLVHSGACCSERSATSWTAVLYWHSRSLATWPLAHLCMSLVANKKTMFQMNTDEEVHGGSEQKRSRVRASLLALLSRAVSLTDTKITSDVPTKALAMLNARNPHVHSVLQSGGSIAKSATGPHSRYELVPPLADAPFHGPRA